MPRTRQPIVKMPSWALHVVAVIVGVLLSFAAPSRAPEALQTTWHAAAAVLVATVAAPTGAIEGAVVRESALDQRVGDHAGSSVCVLVGGMSSIVPTGLWRWLSTSDDVARSGHRLVLPASQRGPPV